jgi:tRNA1Val (adenine37-N6)-methyltransferase
VTADGPGPGRTKPSPLILEQPPRGRYRTNEDAFLLAEHAGSARGTVYDLGAGVGAVGLMVARSSPTTRVVLVERDAELAALARANVCANGLEDRVEVVEGDAAAVGRARRGAASLVVCNPPWVPEGRGRAPSTSRKDARMGDVGPFVSASRDLLGKRGRACFVYPTTNLVDLLLTLRHSGLEAKAIRFVHAKANAPARVAIIDARPGKPGGLVVQSPHR